MNTTASNELIELSVVNPISFHTSVETFMDASVSLGADFLASGGPVTRLEAQLSKAGLHHGFETITRATPSAITVYCHALNEYESHSRASRMESFGIDLGRLSIVDNVLNQFANGRMDANQALAALKQTRQRVRLPSYALHLTTIFGIGMGAGFLSGATFLEAFACGIFSALVQLVIATFSRFFRLTAMFSDFLTCFTAFLLAPAARHFLGLPTELLVIGTLIYIVPGLLLTTAISEIVDQNYLSGSIRLLKALCTFMSMALAYFLALDLSRLFLPKTDSLIYLVNLKPTSFLPWILGSAMIILCSAVEFRAHFKTIPGVLLCGLSGAISFFYIRSSSNLVAPHFFAALVIGIVGYQLSRRYHHPSQIYTVPSILILVPGMLVFSSFSYAPTDNVALPSIIRAILISLAIVFGLACSRLPFRIHQQT